MLADGRATVSATDGRIGYVTREDCAAAAAAVLSSAGHENRAYDITGPNLVGPREIAAAASAVAGKPIESIAADPNAPAARRGFGGPSFAVVSEDVAKLTSPADRPRVRVHCSRRIVTNCSAAGINSAMRAISASIPSTGTHGWGRWTA